MAVVGLGCAKTPGLLSDVEFSSSKPDAAKRPHGKHLEKISHSCGESPAFTTPGAMKIDRRRFLHLAAGAAAQPTFSRVAPAQAYPSRPVRIIVGFAPGGAQDIYARLIGQQLSERIKQPVIIENRPGASGNIGTEAVVRAAPDGYTLLLLGPPNAINATLYDKLNFSFVHDIQPVAGIVREFPVMVVNPSVPAKTVPDFIAYAKANPDRVNMASSGNATGPHLTGELFKMMAGVELVHVPYRGASLALSDLLGGQVQVMIGTSMSAAIEHVRTGKLRVLAVTSATRSSILPDVPTVGEFIPGFESIDWFGVGAPGNTPVEIIDRLNGEINAVLLDPKTRKRLADLGAAPMPMTPADFRGLILGEIEKWAKVIRAANVKRE
jgi:tripartite-type tricarboxylate transporter receptor subunit TctC